jgi:hypothetical protein
MSLEKFICRYPLAHSARRFAEVKEEKWGAQFLSWYPTLQPKYFSFTGCIHTEFCALLAYLWSATLCLNRMPSAMNRRLSHSLPAYERTQLLIWFRKLFVTALCSKPFKILAHVQKFYRRNSPKIREIYNKKCHFAKHVDDGKLFVLEFCGSEFYIQAATCFGSSLPSSGSVCVHTGHVTTHYMIYRHSNTQVT